jgi:hypothetical protein
LADLVAGLFCMLEGEVGNESVLAEEIGEVADDVEVVAHDFPGSFGDSPLSSRAKALVVRWITRGVLNEHASRCAEGSTFDHESGRRRDEEGWQRRFDELDDEQTCSVDKAAPSAWNPDRREYVYKKFVAVFLAVDLVSLAAKGLIDVAVLVTRTSYERRPAFPTVRALFKPPRLRHNPG